MKTRSRRRLHVGLAVFFAVQVPIAVWMQLAHPGLFEKVWKQYLVFLSLYAIVSTHWAGASSETPMTDEEESA